MAAYEILLNTLLEQDIEAENMDRLVGKACGMEVDVFAQ